jgi:hypothetical protein
MADTVNLSAIEMYYYSNYTAILQLATTKQSASTTPQGSTIIDSCPIPIASAGWNQVKLSPAWSLTSNYYYWIIVNTTSMGSGKIIRWYYTADPGSVPDNKPAAVFTTSWLNETAFGTHFNFMLVLKVLPIVVGHPSEPMTYSSPAQVNMRELISGIPILGSRTRLPPETHEFILAANTSVTFLENWTASFKKYVSGAVETLYTAQPGLTYWTALFTSDAKPKNPYMWYNRTLTIMRIPPDWQFDNSDISNDGNINYTSSYTYGSGNVTILQTDNVSSTSAWDADWVISATSYYSITASAPPLVIMGQQFNIGMTAPITSTSFNLTLNDNITGSVLFTRNVSFPSTSMYLPIRLNQTGNFMITFLDEADYTPEVSYLVIPISVAASLTSLSLQSSTLTATYGDDVNITFRYMNTTLGSDSEFPSKPDVVVSTNNLNFTINNVQADGNGWYSFYFHTSQLPSPRMYGLVIMVSYTGTYSNEKPMNLQLNPQAASPIPIIVAGGSSAGAVIVVVAALGYRTRRRVREEKKVEMLKQTISIAHLLTVHLGSGLAVYSRSLGTKESVDPNLISGFLTANQSIMSQVFKGKAPSGLRFADYGEYKVVSHAGKYVMSALFGTEAAGEELQGILAQFTEEFEKKYGKELESWKGDMDVFKDADSIADRVFSLRLISPYTLVFDRLAKVKLSGIERAVVDNARRLSAIRGVFFMPRIVDYLITTKKVKRSKIVDIIDSLVQKGVFKQLTLDEAALIVSQTGYDSKSANENGGTEDSDE